MPDQNQTNDNPTSTSLSMSDVIVSPNEPEPARTTSAAPVEQSTTVKTVANHIQTVHNILVALSSDPSVDEITAAIGLALYLDRIGKRCTSIYSGQTPNILEFLQPEKTFEASSDVLRDFVIALDKNKADHLRYKLDGDYVKIFITPYKTRIDKDDFEFSLGDFNIELVIAINIPSGVDLDDALREHGRVMHDATVINITNGNPGKFGNIEWNDKSKSSISEMIADLLYELGGKEAIMPDEATALLAGIVSATDHFSNNSTTATAMQISARLMDSGANRELISENIGLDSQNMFLRNTEHNPNNEISNLLDINHDDEVVSTQTEIVADLDNGPKLAKDSNHSNDTSSETLPDLNAVIDDLAKAEAIVKPSVENTIEPSIPNANVNISNKQEGLPSEEERNKTKLTPTEDFVAEETTMTAATTPTMQTDQPSPIDPIYRSDVVVSAYPPEQNAPAPANTNPALFASPDVASEPDINGVPKINYTPVSDEDILPPPPTPPVDFSSPMPPTPPTPPSI